MNKDIKAGTKIRIISDCYGKRYNGEEYTIERRNSSHDAWKLKEDIWIYLRDEYEGVNWEVVQPSYKWESKFNIGDKVVWIITNEEYYVVTEIRFYEHGTFYVLNGERFAKESELKLYQEEPIKEMTIEEIIKELGYEIKIKKGEIK